MNHLVVKIDKNCFGVDKINYCCSDDKDMNIISNFLHKNYFIGEVNNRVMLIGRQKDGIFEIFNDRKLEPVKIDFKAGKENTLVIIEGCLRNGEIVIDKLNYLESDELHFGNVKSDLGFKILTNSVVMELDFDKCIIENNIVKYDGFSYRFGDENLNVLSNVKVVGRMADLKSYFDIQVLKIL